MIFRSLWMSVAVAMALLSTTFTTPLAAQEQLQLQRSGSDAAAATKPVLVATLGSLNKLINDVNYISGLLGQREAGGMFGMIAGSMAQGIDMDQPIGVMVMLVDGVPQPMAMLPTADVRGVLQRLEAQAGRAEELDDGTLVIAIGVNTVYIKQVGSWAALAPVKETLDLAPADPTAYFEGLGNEYFLAARVQMQQVPAETRQVLVDQLRQGFDQTMQNSDAPAEARKSAEAQLDALARVINETDEIMIGFNADQKDQQIVQAFSFTAVPGSSLADAYGQQQPTPSKYASVIREDAAMYYHTAVTISPEAAEQAEQQVEQQITMLSGFLEQNDDVSEDDKKAIEELVRGIVDLAIETAREGRADTGALLLADETQARFVLGTFVADGQKAAQLVKDFAAKIEGKPDAPTFVFDADTYNGVTLHRVEVDVPAEEDEARKIFGETLIVHIGTGDKAVYAAVGDDAMALMQQLIDAPTESSVPIGRTAGRLQIKLLPILEYAQSIEPNSTVAAMIDSLLQPGDTGNFAVISENIPNGSKGLVTWSEGLIKAIGAAIRENQPQQAGGF